MQILQPSSWCSSVRPHTLQIVWSSSTGGVEVSEAEGGASAELKNGWRRGGGVGVRSMVMGAGEV